MIKALAMAASVVLLLTGTQIASASCASDAMNSRDSCYLSGTRDLARVDQCNAYYRGDLAQCGRSAQAPVVPMRSSPSQH